MTVPDSVNDATLKYYGVRADCSFDILKDNANHFNPDRVKDVPVRWHDAIIQRMVKSGDSLIDLGCGDGELMAHISYNCRCWLQGIESNEELVNRCVERGLPVCHADLDDILDLLPDNNYTWAVLEDTLFTLNRPLDVLSKMLRVADKSIVTFPNFAHWSIRYTFSLGGRMPVTKAFPYTWYNTPNIHLCSITDFMDWIYQDGVKVLEAWVYKDGRVEKFDITSDHNITAEQALFVIQKG